MIAGLIGDGIGPSLTPALHEAEGRALGIDYSYHRLDTATDRFAGVPICEVLASTEAEGFSGVNVTHPHKQSVTACLDRLDEDAERLGSANTVIFRSGERVGYNTDFGGFKRAVAEGLGDVKGQRVLSVGAGGAGMAVALALIDAGAAVCISDLDRSREQSAMRRLRHARPHADVRVVDGEDLADLALDGAVNCTPLGMRDHPGMAFNPTNLPGHAWVGDIVYFPRETALLRTARDQGRVALDGTGMALWQAVQAFELITGHKPDAERMSACLTSLLDGSKQQELLT